MGHFPSLLNADASSVTHSCQRRMRPAIFSSLVIYYTVHSIKFLQSELQEVGDKLTPEKINFQKGTLPRDRELPVLPLRAGFRHRRRNVSRADLEKLL